MFEHLKKIVAAETARTGKRRTIHLVDGTLRDAHQCLWATRMRTEHMLPIAQKLGDAGFAAIEGIALVQYDASVLFLNQDPFERIRRLRQCITRTPMRGGARGNLMRGFFPVADDITELFVERQIANGITDFGALEALHCWDNIAAGMRVARKHGVHLSGVLAYNLAPGYDDAFYVRKAQELIDLFDVKHFMLADAAGIITLDRVRTLIPAMRGVIGEHCTLEFNTHCLNGLGPLLALEAAVYGADRILTAVDPMANGNSLPASQALARNLRAIGFDVQVNDRALDEVGEYLRRLAWQEGQPLGVPAEYDPSHYVMQFAGGAMSNLEAQLKQAGIADKLPAVLEEIGRVRVELGSPIMVTPYPAIVSAQAVMNVLNKERYTRVPDEVKKYACGYFGALPLPIDPDVKDRIMQNGSRDVAPTPPVLEPVVPGLRKRYPKLDDDQLLLRYMYGDEKIDGLGPTGNGEEFSVRDPLVDLVAGLGRTRRRAQVASVDFGSLA